MAGEREFVEVGVAFPHCIGAALGVIVCVRHKIAVREIGVLRQQLAERRASEPEPLICPLLGSSSGWFVQSRLKLDVAVEARNAIVYRLRGLKLESRA